jgi:hypothetical protein
LANALASGPSTRLLGGVISRVTAAVFGGYGFAAIATVFLSFILPLPRGEAVMAATLLSFAIYVAAVIWVFAARTALRAWLGLAIPAALMAAASYAFTLWAAA